MSQTHTRRGSLDCLVFTFCDGIGDLLPEWACLTLQVGKTFRLTSNFADFPVSRVGIQYLILHRRCWSILLLVVWFGVDFLLWCYRWITFGIGLCHPPGWKNISPDVKFEIFLSHEWEYSFSFLRQEYPPILTSGEMFHPGGWDKLIPEVIHLWRHRTSTPNNLKTVRV